MIWKTLWEDFEVHGRDLTRPGFQAIVVHRFGAWRMTIKSRPMRLPFSAAYKAMFAVVRNVYGIEIPHTVKVGRRVVIEHQGGIVVHGDTVIGDECILRQGVTLGIRNLQNLRDAPVLGNSVSVGAGAKILGRVRIGDRADIGANAVVLKDVPEGALAVGIPAKVVPRSGARVRTSSPTASPVATALDTN